MSEVLGYVRVEHDKLRGLRTVKTIKSFSRGDVVVREKALLNCMVDRDEARLTSFFKASQEVRAAFLEAFSKLELLQYAAVFGSQDFQYLLERCGGEALPQMSSQEVADVMLRWEATRCISKIHFFKHISKVVHSCAAPGHYEFDVDMDMGVVTARYDIQPSTRIGVWLLEDTSMWWKGADVRSQALSDAQVVLGECKCERCQDKDSCRALKCPGGCSGNIMRHGGKMRWLCNQCDFEGSDTSCAGFIEVEQQLIREIGDITELSKQELNSWLDTVESRIGLKHWLAAALWREIYYRYSVQREETSFTAVHCSLQIMEWILTRELPVPPQPVVDELAQMALHTLEFLNRHKEGVRDLRVVFIRAVKLVKMLFEKIDRGLLEQHKPFAGAVINLRRNCSFCRSPVDEDPAYEDDTVSEEDVCVENGPRVCGVCEDLRYCDMGCQKADLQRHQCFCISSKDTFTSPSFKQVLLLNVN